MVNDEVELWREPDNKGGRSCVMISCCAGAELQLRRGDQILLRELYPDKPTLYERAAQLWGARSRTTLVDDAASG